MARNEYLEEAENLYLPVPAYVVSGSPVIVGMIPGVAVTSRDSAGNATVTTEGAYNVTVGTGVVTVGMPIYITSATGVLGIAPGTGIQLFGHALAAKSSGAGVIPVRLAQFAVASDAPA
jgi:predicted RecA/RadA family phage recombinase